MPGKKLRVLAKGTAKVPLHSAHHRDQNTTFIGRAIDHSMGDGKIVAFGHRLVSTPVVIEQLGEDGAQNIDFPEVLRALRDGDLWPADEATAVMARVPFDPKFGDEHDPAVVAGKAPPKALTPTPGAQASSDSSAQEGK